MQASNFIGRLLSTFLLLVSLMGCAATGTPKDIQGRLDYVAGVEFGWSPIGKPVVDGSLAGFVAYNEARQRILTDYFATANEVPGGFGLVDRANAEMKNRAQKAAGEGNDPTPTQEMEARDQVLAEMTDDERKIYWAQAKAFGEFGEVFARSLLEAGAAAVATSAIREILEDPTLTEGMDYLAAAMAARQLAGFASQVDAAVEIEALVGYFQKTHEVYMATTTDL